MEAFLNHRTMNNSHEFPMFLSQENDAVHEDGHTNRKFVSKSFVGGCHMGHTYI